MDGRDEREDARTWGIGVNFSGCGSAAVAISGSALGAGMGHTDAMVGELLK